MCCVRLAKVCVCVRTLCCLAQVAAACWLLHPCFATSCCCATTLNDFEQKPQFSQCLSFFSFAFLTLLYSGDHRARAHNLTRSANWPSEMSFARRTVTNALQCTHPTHSAPDESVQLLIQSFSLPTSSISLWRQLALIVHQPVDQTLRLF